MAERPAAVVAPCSQRRHGRLPLPTGTTRVVGATAWPPTCRPMPTRSRVRLTTRSTAGLVARPDGRQWVAPRSHPPSSLRCLPLPAAPRCQLSAETLYSHLGTSALYDVTSGGSGYCDGEDADNCLSTNDGVNPNTEGHGTLDGAWGAAGGAVAGDLACDAWTGYDGPSGVGDAERSRRFGPVGSTPVVSSVTPNSGQVGAETTVTITGGNFTGATAVHLGPPRL